MTYIMSRQDFKLELSAVKSALPRNKYMVADLLYAAVVLDNLVSIDSICGASRDAVNKSWRHRIWHLARVDLYMSSIQIATLMSRDGSTIRKAQKEYAHLAVEETGMLDEMRAVAKDRAKTRTVGLRLCA